MGGLVEQFIGFFGNLPKELVIFIISMFPILELRGGLIAAALLGVEMWKAIPICMLGNFVPIPFILLFIEKIFKVMKNTKLVKLVDRLEAKANKSAKTIMKHKRFGLTIFVGIPLPMTGAWTGALVAALFKFKLKESIPSVLLGLCMSATIMTILCYGFPSLFSAIVG